jgi:hypothetical protein
VRHFSVPELHDTHGKETFAAVVNHVLANPELTFSYDPPDAKLGGLIRVVATQCLQILATVNHLARLWVLANNVIMIDFVFANLITRGGRRPMSIYHGANIVLVHLFDSSTLTTIRRERGKILGHGECWHGASLP